MSALAFEDLLRFDEHDLHLLDDDDLRLYAEVDRLVANAVKLAGGSVPAVGSPAWWSAEPMPRLTSLLVVAEHHLLADPDRIAAGHLKAASVAISTGMDWSAAAHRLVYDSHAKVAARRRELGPLAGLSSFDPVAARRWVETGSSEQSAT
ncbi:MAG: hypothetical protein ACRDQU_20790 [Pseudonocardiaceae bacterium]